MNLSNDAICYQEGKKVDYIQFRKLLEFPNLIHCYTLKTKGFNIRGNEEKIQYDSYQAIAEELKIDKNAIIRPYQNHTDVVTCIEHSKQERCIFPKELKNVDGLITNQRQIFFSLSYADCTPLLFFDPVKQVVANIHSGWRGTLQRIGQKAVEMMIKQYQCQPSDILCCIGPTIGQCHFEVGEEVAILFQEAFKEMDKTEQIIKKGSKQDDIQKYFIDMVQINKNMLLKKGLLEQNIIDSQLCTVCHQTYFHSYRAMGMKAGRNTAILGMK